jgi:hypothetical protein
MPDLSDLVPRPDPSCNSYTAQAIIANECLGAQNCSIIVDFNRTYTWEVRKVEGKILTCSEAGEEKDGEYCSSRMGGSGNFSSCGDPHGIMDGGKVVQPARTLMVLGSCYEPDFVIGNDRFERAGTIMVLAYIDALGMLILLFSTKWMSDRELDAVIAADYASCTSSDYTVRLTTIPPHKGGSAYVEQLRIALKEHFDRVLNDPKLVPSMAGEKEAEEAAKKEGC